MPILRNAKKSLRQTIKRTELNRTRKETFKEAIKKALSAKSADEAKKLLYQAQKALDKAAKVGTIKKNTAARRL